jgi:CoA:oxalate CoA-transferase
MFGQPVKLSVTPAHVAKAANRIGEHSDLVLEGLAGYSPEKIAGLRERGVI